MVSNTIKLNIPDSSEERVTKQFIQDTLRQFNSGDISLNQARDIIYGYVTPAEEREPRTGAGSLD